MRSWRDTAAGAIHKCLRHHACTNKDALIQEFVPYSWTARPSITATSASVSPYNAYTNASICLSVASIWRCSAILTYGVCS